MTFEEYQQEAFKFMLPTSKNNVYLFTGLGGEVGEVLSLFAKGVRDGTDGEAYGVSLTKELGDVLWFVSNIALLNNISLEDVAAYNIKKLQDRQNRGVIGGSGNDR